MSLEQYKVLKIREVRNETSEMKLFYFDLPQAKQITFKAGQYLTFIFEKGEKEFRRSFSIASSPVIDEPIYIGIKRIPNGNFSRTLFDRAQAGDSLTISGIGGVFTLPDDIEQYRQVFLFAAGSGIVPIYSLIKTLVHSFPHIKLVLVYSNKSVEQTAFYLPLIELQAAFPGTLHIEFLFSNSGDLLRARLHADLVAIYLETLAIETLNKCLYYMCGPESYMRFCTFVLQGHHIPAENIKKEIFYTARPINRIEPPDKSAYRVSIKKGNHDYEIMVQFPVTILQAARSYGIDLPYSCEVGRCGNCMATCTSGRVWMSYNEVLTERELAKGMVLTCTGYPMGGDVRLLF